MSDRRANPSKLTKAQDDDMGKNRVSTARDLSPKSPDEAGPLDQVPNTEPKPAERPKVKSKAELECEDQVKSFHGSIAEIAKGIKDLIAAGLSTTTATEVAERAWYSSLGCDMSTTVPAVK